MATATTTTGAPATPLSPMQRFLFCAVALVLAFTGAYLLSETILRFFGDVAYSLPVAAGRISFGVLALVFALICLNVLASRGRSARAER